MASKSGSGRRAKRTGSNGRPSPRWLIPVAVVSAFVGFLVYLDSMEPESGTTPETVPTVEAPETEGGSEASRPEFRFYEMLPESEVITPDTDAYDPEPDMAAQDREYILQAGAFRTREDAERQRAQVGFQGLRTHIRKVSVGDDRTWYRVMVGPFSSRSDMNRAVDRLVSINIQPLVRQRETRED